MKKIPRLILLLLLLTITSGCVSSPKSKQNSTTNKDAEKYLIILAPVPVGELIPEEAIKPVLIDTKGNKYYSQNQLNQQIQTYTTYIGSLLNYIDNVKEKIDSANEYIKTTGY